MTNKRKTGDLTYRQINPHSLPDIRTTDKGKKLAAVQSFTVPNYMKVMQLLGYKLRSNIMTGEVEVWKIDGAAPLNSAAAFDVLETMDDALARAAEETE